MQHIDKQSLERAYQLYDSGEFSQIEVGTIKGLKQIHVYLFEGLYDFAGEIRSQNISKGNFQFANAMYLPNSLQTIEQMPDEDLQQSISKYIELNIAHPFMDGNGRAMRIWLDLLLRTRVGKIVNWQNIGKETYFHAMEVSPFDDSVLRNLLTANLTSDVDNSVMIQNGLDQSYFYEGLEKDKHENE